MTVLTVPDAKTYLNITVETFDYELTAMIAAAQQVVERQCGPLEPTTVTDRLDISGGYSFTVRTTPVISLTSATSIYGSTTADVSMLHVSPSGVVTWGDGISRFYWGAYDVTYQAGYSPTPAALVTAVKEWTRYLWMTQRGTSNPNLGADPAVAARMRAEMLMEPYVQEFGFA